ncbi:hypothetical protein EV196_11613 [Mariniflexile fucanivorans]|uniref:Uncharacterized protein n=1 Tax=Mariniflexile fucanivorans TaxID=264023 RepID=A0A4R1R932_9FLAO|nr:hypothetical protein EV196_11613 [Mariniflexile fucanivorans]
MQSKTLPKANYFLFITINIISQLIIFANQSAILYFFIANYKSDKIFR